MDNEKENRLIDAKKNNDSQMVYDLTISFVAELTNSFDFSKAYDLLEENRHILQTREQKIKFIDLEVECLLHLEEFEEVITKLEIKEKKFNQVDMLTYFYKAIAYEALDDFSQAINSLCSLEDKISTTNLINKYLKLSLLYIKINDLKKANEAYKYALLLDPNRKNEMFDLVFSDLLFSEKKYQESLEYFESFFLKSSNKYKYLDRYIFINIKLNNLSDAYSFYENFKDKASLKVSKLNKYLFYKAAYQLFIALGKNDEIPAILDLLAVLKPNKSIDRELKNREQKVLNLLIDSLNSKNVFAKKRDVILYFFRLLGNLEFKVLGYVDVTLDDLVQYRFNKGLLLEKRFSFAEIEGNFLGEIIRCTEDTRLPSYINEKNEILEQEIEIFKVGNDIHNFGYVYYSDSKKKVSKEVINLVKELLINKMLLLTDSVKVDDSLTKTLKLFSEYGFGIFKLKNQFITLLNDSALTLFNVNKTVLSYTELSGMFTNKVYLDSFYNKDEQKLDVLINGERKKYFFRCANYKDEVFVFFTDCTKQALNDETLKSYFYTDGTTFKNKNALFDSIAKCNDAYMIMGINLEIEDVLLFDQKNNFLSSLYQVMNRNNKDELFILENNTFLILSKQTDKRVINTMFKYYNEQISAFFSNEYKGVKYLINGFAYKALKGKTQNDIKEIIEYGFNLVKNKNGFLLIDNEQKKEYALYKTFEAEIIKRIKNESLELIYRPVINEESKEIYYFYLKPLFGRLVTDEVMERIIKYNLLEIDYDLLILKSVINEISKLDIVINIIYEIHEESLNNDEFIKKFVSLVKKYPKIKSFVFTLRGNLHHVKPSNLMMIRKLGLNFGINITDYSFADDSMNMVKIIHFDKYVDDVHLIDYLIKKGYRVIIKNEFVENTLTYRDSYKAYTIEEIKKQGNKA